MKKTSVILSACLAVLLAILLAWNIAPVLNFYFGRPGLGLMFWFGVGALLVLWVLTIFSEFIRTDSSFLLLAVLITSVLAVVFVSDGWGWLTGLAAIVVLVILRIVAKPAEKKIYYSEAHPFPEHPW